MKYSYSLYIFFVFFFASFRELRTLFWLVASLGGYCSGVCDAARDYTDIEYRTTDLLSQIRHWIHVNI